MKKKKKWIKPKLKEEKITSNPTIIGAGKSDFNLCDGVCQRS